MDTKPTEIRIDLPIWGDLFLPKETRRNLKDEIMVGEETVGSTTSINGSSSVAIGWQALPGPQTNNVLIGPPGHMDNTGIFLSTMGLYGTCNAAFGYQADFNPKVNMATAVGYRAVATEDKMVQIGSKDVNRIGIGEITFIIGYCGICERGPRRVIEFEDDDELVKEEKKLSMCMKCIFDSACASAASLRWNVHRVAPVVAPPPPK